MCEKGDSVELFTFKSFYSKYEVEKNVFEAAMCTVDGTYQCMLSINRTMNLTKVLYGVRFARRVDILMGMNLEGIQSSGYRTGQQLLRVVCSW